MRILSVALLAGIAWMVASPYLTLMTLRTAVQEGDTDTISAHIDFPALRDSIKAEMLPILDTHLKQNGQDPDMAMFGSTLAMGMAGVYIDQAVSPAGLTKILQNVQGSQTQKPGIDNRPVDEFSKEWSVKRTGVFTFELQVMNEHTLTGSAAKFSLQGVRWTLDGVSLSPQAIQAFMQ